MQKVVFYNLVDNLDKMLDTCLATFCLVKDTLMAFEDYKNKQKKYV